MSSEQDLSDKIDIVMRQTNYTDTEAHEQLELYHFYPVLVIRKFLGISDAPKIVKPVSLNQETYKQIRLQLDSGIREFKQRSLQKE